MPFSVEVTSANGTKETFNFTATRAVPGVTLLTNVNFTSSGSSLGAAVTNIQSNALTQTMSISTNATSATINITRAANCTIKRLRWSNDTNWTDVVVGTNDTRSFTIPNMPTAGNSKEMQIEVEAPDGQLYTIKITVTNSTSVVNLMTKIDLRTSNVPTGGSSVDTISSTINNSSSTQNMTISNSFTNTTLYAHITLASGATLSSATFGGSTATISNGSTSTAKYVTLSMPTTTTSRDLVLNFSGNYSVTINISRSSGAVTLANSINIRTGTSSTSTSAVSYSTAITSSSSAPTITIPSSYSSTYTFYLHVSLPSNSSITSASGTGVSYSSSNNYVTLSYPSGITSRSVTLYFSVNGSSYNKTLTINRGQSVVQNASLSSLTVNNSSTSSSSGTRYTLTPTFSYATTTYDVSLSRTLSVVYLHFNTYQSGATVTVTNANRVSDRIYSATLTTDRTKTVTIRVTYSGSTTTYTINLNSGNSGNKNARLSNLRVYSEDNTSSSYLCTMVPSFSSSIEDYVALVPYDRNNNDTVYVRATLEDTGDTLTIDGSSVGSDVMKEISISSRSNRSTSVPIRVRDGNSNTSDYNLTVIAAPSSANTDTALSSLSLRTGSSTSTALSFNRSFSSSVYSYTADEVDNNTQSVRVYFDTNDSNAWVLVNDVLEDSDYATVNLAEGSNSIKVQVYAEDCKTSRTYTISVNRGSGGSSDATLSNLEVRYGTATNQMLNLIPAFDKTITSYRINLDTSITQIAFRPTTSDSGASIRFTGSVSITSGQWTSNNTLSADSTIFTFQVTSADGNNTTTYMVTVDRGLYPVVSPQKMKVNGVEVSCAAYNINGNNYFKLRDIAYSMRGTAKRFDVTYNDATRVISMISGRDYTIIGGEMIRPTTNPTKCVLSNQSVQVDGSFRNFTAYNIYGNNYFMLREIGALFNFAVDYDQGTNTMLIDTSKIYTPDIQ